VPLPATDAPILLRALALAPGAVMTAMAVVMEVRADRQVTLFAAGISSRAVAIIAFGLLVAGAALPYLVYGVRTA